MLVLGRKPGEYVMIGHSIKVQVIKSKDGDLRLAITAPKEVSILRGEIFDTVNDAVNDESTSSPFLIT